MQVVAGAIGKLKGKADGVGARLGKSEGGVSVGSAGIIPGGSVLGIHTDLEVADALVLEGHNAAILGARRDGHAESRGLLGSEVVLGEFLGIKTEPRNILNLGLRQHPSFLGQGWDIESRNTLLVLIRYLDSEFFRLVFLACVVIFDHKVDVPAIIFQRHVLVAFGNADKVLSAAGLCGMRGG